MKKLIKPAPLRKGQTIGIIAPCNGMSEAGIAPAVEAIRSLGFEVKLGEHVFSRTDGYGGSAEERASDFNSMIADDSVSMLLFPGGEIAIEILPRRRLLRRLDQDLRSGLRVQFRPLHRPSHHRHDRIRKGLRMEDRLPGKSRGRHRRRISRELRHPPPL